MRNSNFRLFTFTLSMDLLTQKFCMCVCVWVFPRVFLICYSGRTLKNKKQNSVVGIGQLFPGLKSRDLQNKSLCLWPRYYNGTAKRERERTFYIKVKTKQNNKKTFHSRPSPAKRKLSSNGESCAAVIVSLYRSFNHPSGRHRIPFHSLYTWAKK